LGHTAGFETYPGGNPDIISVGFTRDSVLADAISTTAFLGLGFSGHRKHHEGLAIFLVANSKSIQEFKARMSSFWNSDAMSCFRLLEHPTRPLSAELSFPLLQVFSGSLVVFLRLARHQPGCFQTTHTVDLCVDGDVDTNRRALFILGTLGELPRPLLPALKHSNIGIQCSLGMKARHYGRLVRRFAWLIGDSLETWRILSEPWFLGLHVKTQVLGISLAKFKRLKVIHLDANYPNTSLTVDEDSEFDSEWGAEDADSANESGSIQSYLTTKTILGYVHTLAIHCPSLELVMLEDFSLAGNAEFKIERRERFDDFRVHVPKEFALEGAWVGSA
jgi:hypothetical protein